MPTAPCFPYSLMLLVLVLLLPWPLLLPTADCRPPVQCSAVFSELQAASCSRRGRFRCCPTCWSR